MNTNKANANFAARLNCRIGSQEDGNDEVVILVDDVADEDELEGVQAFGTTHGLRTGIMQNFTRLLVGCILLSAQLVWRYSICRPQIVDT